MKQLLFSVSKYLLIKSMAVLYVPLTWPQMISPSAMHALVQYAPFKCRLYLLAHFYLTNMAYMMGVRFQE